MSNCNQSKQGGCTCTPDLFEEEARDLSHLPSTYPPRPGEAINHLPDLPAPVGLLPSTLSLYPGLDTSPSAAWWCAFFGATPDDIRAACAVLNLDSTIYGIDPQRTDR